MRKYTLSLSLITLTYHYTKMKMHKKLFGLLATAVVGLTLTSCGGGGGGGGGNGGEDVSDEISDLITDSVSSLAPASLSGIRLQVNIRNSSRIETLDFVTATTVENTYITNAATGETYTLAGNYTYTPKAGKEGRVVANLRTSNNNNYSFAATFIFENGRVVDFTDPSGEATKWSSVYQK